MSGSVWLGGTRVTPGQAIDAALNYLDTLPTDALPQNSAWGQARTFDHLAQSIEYSMAGFPTLKSPFFRGTIGPVAFRIFTARGRMSHGLDDEIPGEIIDTSRSASVALTRIKEALTAFDAHSGPMQPHFAYGKLTKNQYALAHVMHIQDHLSAG